MTTETATATELAQDPGWRTGLLWSGAIALSAGLVIHRSWEQWHSGRAGELLLIASAVLGSAALLAKLTRWSLATSVALHWCLALLVFAGALPVAATALFAIAAMTVGGIVSPRTHPALQGLLGTALFSAVLGWLLPLPAHHGWVYAAACVAMIGWRYRELGATWRTARAQWTDAVSAAPRAAVFAVVALGLASTGSWLPTLQFDDLAYHLWLPSQLQEQGVYSLDPRFQVWALAPWASDVLHSVPQLISGSEARGPLNTLWLAVAATGIWRLAAQLGGPVLARWLSIALFASLPLSASLAGSMQTELPTAAVLVWLAAIAGGPAAAGLRWWLALAMLVGLMVAMKLTAAAMAGLLLLWALLRHPWPSVPRILIVIGVAGFVAASSYTYAWAVSGNPVLPLFNGWFQSSYFAPTNDIDQRWQAGFDIGLPWNITFDTDQYLEAYDGGGGFLLVALAGAWLLSLVSRHTRPLSIVATVVLLLPLTQIQYLRYAYPGMVLLTPVLVVAALHRTTRHATWLVIGLCVLNLAFQSNSHWILRTGALKSSVKHLGKDAPLHEKYAPERLLAKAIREGVPASPNVLILDPSRPYYAEFGGKGRSPSWYSPPLQAAAEAANRDPSGAAWVALMRQQDIGEVITRPEQLLPAQSHALQSLGAVRRLSAGGAEWWSLPDEERSPP